MSESPHAELEWDNNGEPFSPLFGDLYFSRTSGLEETRHVFLEGNRLPARFAELEPGSSLQIGETGFGTGLNFLCAWQLFEQYAASEARLHFISVEKYPLQRSDLQRALALWPELAGHTAQLLQQYVAIHPGFQRMVFAGGRVVLTLLIGDVLEQLPELDARIDAWFLDGFSPARNPQMWTPELFAQLARLSSAQATLATFTSAGFVRRGLQDAGFAMRRERGFGKKWHMLCGIWTGQTADANKYPPAAAWYARPGWHPPERSALVIGAGLAGCATAASLAARGWQVTLLERHADLAMEASGNPQGVLYLKLSAHGTALSRLILAGFGYTRRLLEQLEQGHDWQACGVLQLAFNAAEQQRQNALSATFAAPLLEPLSQAGAEQVAGVNLNCGGLFFAEAGWVHPPALCRLLAGHPRIRLVRHREVLELQRQGDLWRARSADGLDAQAAVVVLAGAADVARFEACASFPLKRIRGQISSLARTPASAELRTVLCAEGYVAPARNRQHTLGASFDFQRSDLQPSLAEHQDNLEMLREISADLHARLQPDSLHAEQLAGRASFRCTTADYLPLVGPLADARAFAECYAALGKDARLLPQTPCPWLDGLYVNAAHGSRGLISAPLSGELLAAWLENEPLPVPVDVAQACHPNRFLLRKLVRGQALD